MSEGGRTGLRGEWTPDCQLHGENRVRVAVRDAVAAAVEGAYVVCLCASCACELRLRGLDLLLWLDLLLAHLLWWHAGMLQRALCGGWRAVGAQGTFLREQLLRRLMLLLLSLRLMLRGRTAWRGEVLLLLLLLL
jgi:hypothetical protein